MLKRFTLPGDELESAVLATLWEGGTFSIRGLHDRIGEPRGVVYTTIAKVVDRLRAKRLIQRERSGKTFVYRARIAREDVERALAQKAVNRLLGSTPRAAAAALVDAIDAINPALIDELERAVAARRRSKDGT